MSEQIKVGIFPSAGNVHLYHAVESGLFEGAGLDVTLEFVKSSDQQIENWDTGVYRIMHTSPDHLLRPGRQRDPIIVLGGGVGELAVYHRAGADLEHARWGVDGAGSAYALVLRAIVGDVVGRPVTDDQLIPVGGTKERLDIILEGGIDGTTLSPPFSEIADRNGLVRLGGHLEHIPNYLTTVVVASRADRGSEWLDAYIAVVRTAAEQLQAAGVPGIAATLVARGWEEAVSVDAASGMLSPAGLQSSARFPEVEDLQAVVDLRQRFYPEWAPAGPLEALFG